MSDRAKAAKAMEIAEIKDLPDYLASRIIGQSEVIPRLSQVLQHGELGLSRPDRPKGSFLFLGPTGVGKTEITLAFTKRIFGSEDRVCRLDMSEFQLQDSLPTLLGGPGGQSEFAQEGRLGAFDRATGGSVGTILFDEIEKGHKLVLDVFLQILDAGRISLGSGRTLDLSKCYIVATSNIGAQKIMALQRSPYATLDRIVRQEAQRALRPEIFARFTGCMVFNLLKYNDQVEVCKLMLAGELRFQAKNGHRIEADDNVIEYLVQEGYHPRLGARPMRSAVERNVRNAIAERLLAGQPATGRLVVEGERLAIRQATARLTGP